MANPRSPFLGKGSMHPFVYLSIGFWLYTALQCRSSMSSNCLVFHTSGGISSSPAAFLFLIFLRTESSSSCVNGSSLMSNCLLIILVIGSGVIFGGFPSKFSKCCFHSFILSCWFAALSFALAVFFLLLTSFIVCQAYKTHNFPNNKQYKTTPEDDVENAWPNITEIVYLSPPPLSLYIYIYR